MNFTSICTNSPITPIATRTNVEETLAAVGLTDIQQAAILSGNTLRLLTRHARPR
ncbi:MAG: hypothetical protein M3Y76_09205 [Chloroflexota bacterium]|nr:hypothetical protein [Chloroflexota bacterium]